MKKIILCLLLVATILTASSQKVYFVYFQTESEQPFFVKINNKIHSSTSSGYLILSKLIDSSYNFSIGFPQNKWAEQKFSIDINKRDHGFLLKQFGEKGWGLYNLQTLAVQMPSNASAKTDAPIKKENKDVSQFTDILSKVADDPSIKEKPVQPKVVEKTPEVVVKKEEKKEEPIVAVKDKIETKPVVEKKVVEETKPVEVAEKNREEKAEPIVEVKKQNEPLKEVENSKSNIESYAPSQVSKWSESSTTDGFGLVFIDEFINGEKDTIRLLIPNPKQIEVPVSAKSENKEEKKFIDIDDKIEKKKDETILTEVKAVVAGDSKEKQMLSNNCTLVADESDFFQLRKQMAAKESDEAMITEARKYFKTKCFTAEQIKNLGALFLKDESKYNFFDAAYNYVSDAEKFPPLQNELTDEYYINRFRAMLRN